MRLKCEGKFVAILYSLILVVLEFCAQVREGLSQVVRRFGRLQPFGSTQGVGPARRRHPAPTPRHLSPLTHLLFYPYTTIVGAGYSGHKILDEGKSN